MMGAYWLVKKNAARKIFIDGRENLILLIIFTLTN